MIGCDLLNTALLYAESSSLYNLGNSIYVLSVYSSFDKHMEGVFVYHQDTLVYRDRTVQDKDESYTLEQTNQGYVLKNNKQDMVTI